LQPEWNWASGLRASVDYYSIKVKDVVTSIAATEVLRRCGIGQQLFCNQIDFDNSRFGIALLRNQPFNLAELETKGLDIEVIYNAPGVFGLPGNLSLRALATHVMSLKTTDASGTVDRAGSFQQNGVPSWTASANLTYSQGGFAGTIVGRFFSASDYDANFRDPTQEGYDSTSPNSINDNRFPSQFYLDLGVRYTIEQEGRRSIQLFGNVDNVMDKKPPYNAFLINSGGNPFDLIGRGYKVGARMTF
jgi:iron complex outermembrane recepter protein